MSTGDALEEHLVRAGAVFADADGHRRVAGFGDPAGEYEAITQSAAVVDLSCRDRFEITGNDRAAFLHNLCTNEIRKLGTGAGCEAFLLNVQGKILGHVIVLCQAESLIVETVPAAAPALLEHLERYHIREAVEFVDRGADWGELLVAGPQAGAILSKLTGAAVPAAHLSGMETSIGGVAVSLWRIELPGLTGYLSFMSRSDAATVWQQVAAAGARPAGGVALETVRIEAGWPNYGQDISDHNLPQELARDSRAISFVKGCYLGQETVARIDALGHVNKLLVSLRFDGAEVPPRGTALTNQGQPVGEITSATFSPRRATPLALGYVRRGSHAPGTRLDSAQGQCEVVAV